MAAAKSPTNYLWLWGMWLRQSAPSNLDRLDVALWWGNSRIATGHTAAFRSLPIPRRSVFGSVWKSTPWGRTSPVHACI
jgi:hypothetical protein